MNSVKLWIVLILSMNDVAMNKKLINNTQMHVNSVRMNNDFSE